MLHAAQVGFVETHSRLHPDVRDVDELFVGDRLAALADPAQRQQRGVAPAVALQIVADRGRAFALADDQVHEAQLLKFLSLV